MLTHIFSRRYAHHHAMLIVFLASALWGVLWIPMRYTESFGLSGLWVVTMFHLLPAIAMSPFVISAFIADRRHWFITGLAGGLMGIGFVLYGLGLVVASVTKTTVLFYLTPVWATLFAYILLSERFGFGRWLAIIGGITGCFLVMRVNPFAFGYDNADLLGLMSGMAWAAGSVVIRRYPKADFLAYHIYAISCWRAIGWWCGHRHGRCHSRTQSCVGGIARCVSGIGGGVFAICIIDFSHYAISIAGACWHFDAVGGAGGGVVILAVSARNLNPMAMGWGGGYSGYWGVCWPD